MRSMSPLNCRLPLSDHVSFEDSTSNASQTSPSPSDFCVNYDGHNQDTGSEESSNIWWSILEDKGLLLNAPTCLQDMDIDEGYVDYSSTYSSGILSPDLDFLGLKGIREFYNNENTINSTDLVSIQTCNSKAPTTDCFSRAPWNESNEFTFDDCALPSLPPSPEISNCFDFLLQSPFSSSSISDQQLHFVSKSSSSTDHFSSSDRKYCDPGKLVDDFSVSCLSFDDSILPSPSDHFQSDSLSEANNPAAHNELSNQELLSNIFVSHKYDDFDASDFQDCQSQSSMLAGGRHDKRSHDVNRTHSSAREDHGYAAKMPLVSSSRFKKRGFTRLQDCHRSAHSFCGRNLPSLNSPSSLLEIFLTSNKTLDPNKGSNAALACEMRRFKRQVGPKSERLLEKLLTSDKDRRRVDTKH